MMKTFDKDKQDEEAFRKRAEADRRHADRAKASMALANRPAGSEMRTGTIAVNVRANPRQGHDGFRRGGYLWPSDPDGIDVAVTEQLYECLDHEPNVNIRRIDADPSTLESRDVPERHEAPMPDVPGGRQVSPTERDLERDMDRFMRRAEKQLGELAEENERLRRELAEAKSGAGKPVIDHSASLGNPNVTAPGDDDHGKGKAPKK